MDKMCQLYDNTVCTGCRECMMCDLEPDKECSSCGKCLESDGTFRSINIASFFRKE